MKVSVNWIREINRRYHCSAEPMPDGIEVLVDKIGAQLGAVDAAIDLNKKYESILVVKIVSCKKHPNADKLFLCKVDDGGAAKGLKRDKDGLVQVVCGAPNAKAGLLAAWIPPGVVVPSTFNKDPFVLETREIRGEASNGMLASPKELDLGDNHDGILEIDEPAKPGQAFVSVYALDDFIIDIENKMFTHRPDLFGQLGIAREIAGIQGHVFKSPKWYKTEAELLKPKNGTLKLKVKNEVPEIVPRFVVVAMANIKVGPSPLWLSTYLSRVGIRPINNVVDVTNFLMMETAQPLHAYDYDKLNAEVGVRLSKEGEELRLLGGKTIKLDEGAVVVTDGEKPIGLGGVMGGAETEVDKTTKNIIIECGTFDMNITRKTAMRYGLFTDAATRFSKNQSPLQNSAVIARAVDLIKDVAGGRIASLVEDNFNPKVKSQKPKTVEISADFVNERLGLKLMAVEISKLLENVEFQVERVSHRLKISVPFWRTDIKLPEDIVEEVGRLYGYDRLPLVLPKRTIKPAQTNKSIDFKTKIREVMQLAGANELLTYSFVHGSLLEAAGADQAKAFHIKNALSPDLQYYRTSLLPSLLEKTHPNIKSGFDSFILYEIGSGHVKGVNDEDNLPSELERLGVVTADKSKSAGAAYYRAKQILDFLLIDGLEILNLKFKNLAGADNLPPEWQVAAAAYEPNRSAAVYSDDNLIGMVGEPSMTLKSKLKLPATAAGFELDIAAMQKMSLKTSSYKKLNRFPQLDQDICLKLAAEKSYESATTLIEKILAETSEERGYHYQLLPIDIYQRPQELKNKQITWRITLSHPERTLTTEESNRLLDKIADAAKKKLNAERI